MKSARVFLAFLFRAGGNHIPALLRGHAVGSCWRRAERARRRAAAWARLAWGALELVTRGAAKRAGEPRAEPKFAEQWRELLPAFL